MKTSFDVVDKVYALLNIAAVKATIDGHIWKHRRPINNSKRDIVIVSLPIDGAPIIQKGTFFVNIFCKNFDNGLPNEVVLKATLLAARSALETKSASSEYFELELIAEDLLPDQDDISFSYISLRYNFSIEQ